MEVLDLDAILVRAALPAQPARNCPFGTDGARWIIESVDPSTGYTYLNRWSPEEGPVRELGLHLVALTGWEIANIY